MDALLPAAAAHGIKVDAVACANAKGTNGRPKPWLSTAVAEALDVYPLSAIVKVTPRRGGGRCCCKRHAYCGAVSSHQPCPPPPLP
jgi:hypothetical protein